MILLEKKILRLQRKSNAIFKLFQKMIDKLIKHNTILNEICLKADEERQYQLEIMLSSQNLIEENNRQIRKLNSFIGKEEN